MTGYQKKKFLLDINKRKDDSFLKNFVEGFIVQVLTLPMWKIHNVQNRYPLFLVECPFKNLNALTLSLTPPDWFLYYLKNLDGTKWHIYSVH